MPKKTPSDSLSRFLADRTPDVLRELFADEKPTTAASLLPPREIKVPKLMSTVERRQAERLPKPTQNELERVAVVSKIVEEDDIHNFRPRKPLPRSKLVLATKNRHSPRLTGSRLYDGLIRKARKPERVIPTTTEQLPPRKKTPRKQSPTKHESAPQENKPLDLIEYLGMIEGAEELPEVKAAKRKASLERLVQILGAFSKDLLQKAWGQWKSTAATLTAVLTKEAQLLLTTTARKYLAVLEVRERKKRIVEQVKREQRHAAMIAARQSRMAQRVQRAARRFTWMRRQEEMERRVSAALVLQRRYRGYVVRNTYRAILSERRARERVGLACQRMRRGALGRKRSRVFAAMRRSDILVQRIERRHEVIRSELRVRGAAYAIQSRWRHRSQERVARVRQRMRRVKQRTVLLNAFRRYLRRASRRRNREIARRSLEAKLRVAIWLQVAARRKAARARLEELRFDARVQQVARCKYRAFKASRRKYISPMAVALYYLRRMLLRPSDAATLIAAVYRGHRVRSRMHLRRLRARLEKKQRLAKARDAAATKVQCCMRGLMARRTRNCKHLARATLTIQTRLRVCLGKRRFKRRESRHLAAIKIQTLVRMVSATRTVLPVLLFDRACRGSVGIVQAHVRGIAARRRVTSFRREQRRLAEASLKAICMAKRYRLITRAELAFESYEAPADYPGEFQAAFAAFCRTHPPSDTPKKAMSWRHALRLAKNSVSASRRLSREFDTQSSFWSAQQQASKAEMGSSEMVKLFRGILEPREVDLIFAREKSKFVSFDQFRGILDIVGAELRPSVKTWKGGASGRAARALSLLYTMLEAPWAKSIRSALAHRADMVLDMAATKLQRRYRIVYAVRRVVRERARRARDARRKKERRAAILMQARCARGPLARRLVETMALSAYQKLVVEKDELLQYSPTDEPCYYYSSRRGNASWTKPRLLRNSDVERVTLRPNKNTAFVVDCAYCASRPATALCLDSCGDSYCDTCWTALHCRGHRRTHAKHRIPTCVDCGGGRQPASRVCSTCSSTDRKQVTLCDTCFHNRHHQHSVRRHRWTALVEMCCLCGDYAARWDCDMCESAFCGSCFGAFHSRGARLKHTCRRLGYYTPSAKKRDDRIRRIEARRRRLAERTPLSIEGIRESAATKLQAAWRRKRDRRVGLDTMRHRRRILRIAYAKRVADRPQRGSLRYRFLDYFGKAPNLASDSRSETVLKRIPAFRRRRAIKFISQNEWVAPEDPKKLRKRGFDAFDDLDVLKLQARLGGVALPARGVPKAGSRHVEIYCADGFDLKCRVAPNDRLYLGKTLVYVVQVEAAKLTMRTCWLLDTDRDGQTFPIYLLPPLSSSVDRAVATWQILARENCVSQTIIECAHSVTVGVAETEKSVAKRYRRKYPRMATRLKTRSKRHYRMAERIRWRTLVYQRAEDEALLDEMLAPPSTRKRQDKSQEEDVETALDKMREASYLAEDDDDDSASSSRQERFGAAALRKKILLSTTLQQGAKRA